eukprot:905247-Rhodomonas_salina.1
MISLGNPIPISNWAQPCLVVMSRFVLPGMVPIISWIHHDAEVRASTVDGNNYVDWYQRLQTQPDPP